MSTAAELTLGREDQLEMEVFSVADLGTEDRLAKLWRAFDAHPGLRPLKVGISDPPRIKIGDSMVAALAEYSLPFRWWFMVRQSKPVYEGGDLKLWLGRGSWWEERRLNPEGTWSPHSIRMCWSAEWIRSQAAEREVADLFVEVCQAMDACYGMVYQVHQAGQWLGFFPRRSRSGEGDLERELRDVFWLNWFGPAFVDRFPGLSSVAGARPMPRGALLVETTDIPWMFDPAATSPDAYAWKQPLYEVLGRSSFATPGVAKDVKPAGHLPSLLQHTTYSTGTDELPKQRWDREHAESDLRKELERRAKRFERAKRALEATTSGSAPKLGRSEFSAAFDLEDVPPFWRKVTRRFKGDLARERGKDLLAAISSAPLDSEEEWEVVLEGPDGPELAAIRWFIDDLQAVDLFVFGSPGLIAELGRLHES